MNNKAVLLIPVFLLMTCNRQPPGARPAEDRTEMPDQEIWDSQVILTSAGKKNAVLTADHIRKYENRKEMLVEGVTVDFYDQDGQHASVLTARRGKVDEQTNNLEAEEKVVVVSDDGIRLETEHLVWDNKREKIISRVFCKITTPVDTVTGVGIESDPNLEHWEIKSRVQGSFKRKVDLEQPGP